MNSMDIIKNKASSFKKSRKGFTLIEIVVSVAIIALLAVSLVPLLSFGFNQTVISGQKSTAVLGDVTSMEGTLSGTTDAITTGTDKTLIISFGGTIVTVAGKLYEAGVTFGSSGDKAIVTAFKPN